MICSRCGMPLKDIVIRIEQKLDVYKIATSGILTPLSNLSEPTSEFLCERCFEKYANCIDTLNDEYQGQFLVDMVEVIDDIQYGD